MYEHVDSLRRSLLLGTLAVSLALGACQSLQDLADTAPAGSGPTAGTFVWHDLITHDLQQAQSFYGELFNWRFEPADDRDGNPYMLARVDNRYSVGLLQLDRPADGSNYARWLGYMAVDQLDRALEVTGAAGGQLIDGSVEQTSVGRAAAIMDPEQAVLGLLETELDVSAVVLREAPGAVIWNELLSDAPGTAAAFYSALADVSTETIQRRGGNYTLLHTGNNPVAGVMDNPFESAQPLWLTYIAVVDPAATAARVEALGGKVLLAPSPELRDGNMALIQDPGGAILALQRWPTSQGG